MKISTQDLRPVRVRKGRNLVCRNSSRMKKSKALPKTKVECLYPTNTSEDRAKYWKVIGNYERGFLIRLSGTQPMEEKTKSKKRRPTEEAKAVIRARQKLHL